MGIGTKLAGLLRRRMRALGFDIVRIGDPYRLSVYEQLFDKKELAHKPFFNIGAGSFYHPYWTNIDYVSEWYRGVQTNVCHHDLMSLSPLPIESSSAHIVYTSHTIEHVTHAAVSVLFKEAHRVLRAGGVLRVTTAPDAETNFKALQRNDSDWFYWDHMYSKPGTYEHIFERPAPSAPLEERWLHHFASQLAPNDRSPSPSKVSAKEIRELIEAHGFPDVLDVLTSRCQFNPQRPGNHISWWTHDRIIGLMRDAGFSNVYRSGYRQSASPLLRQSDLFDSTHPQISIYVEAIKS